MSVEQVTIPKSLAVSLAHIVRAVEDFGGGSKYVDNPGVSAFAEKHNPRPKPESL